MAMAPTLGLASADLHRTLWPVALLASVEEHPGKIQVGQTFKGWISVSELSKAFVEIAIV